MADQGDVRDSDGASTVGITRLAVGFAQGIAAWLLLELAAPTWRMNIQGKPAAQLWWSQQHPIWFASLSLLAAFIPVLALAEIGRMRARPLAIYLVAAATMLAALVGYHMWSDPVDNTFNGASPRIWPSASFIFCTGLGTFIVNQLIEHRARRHSLFTEYAAHFEDSWMRGFQFVISLVFTLLVWGVLELGSALFNLIHVEWFGRMIDHNWFRCPALAIAFAASVQITDVRTALVTGMRNLGLTLLSWLLPLVVALGCAFLVALGFTGLTPLWGTRFAASMLLWAVVVTLVLVNAAYKDGDPAHLPVLPIRVAGRIAGPMMLILTLLATYAIILRVGQHGWTPARVRSFAIGLIALIYGVGYTWANVGRTPWLKRLEQINVIASLAILATLVLLFSPLADPGRLAVDSQVARLKSGAVASSQFDYQFLRFDAGRYGTDALAVMTTDRNADIASRARQAQATAEKSYRQTIDPATTEPALSHVTVYPQGETLPADFVAKNIADGALYGPSDCLRNGSPCDIIVWKGAVQGSPLLIIRSSGPSDDAENSKLTRRSAKPANVAFSPFIPVFGRGTDGQWRNVGTIGRINCSGIMDSLRKGAARSVRPAHDDLQVNGVTLKFNPNDSEAEACPAQAPSPNTPVPKTPVEARAPARMGPAFGNP
ncbi:hypothetical protein [Novosphingobium sp.]|uniref:hypothetical protein n=1 Tax=Novosphingobium sp. TaxID=1874826 RepID=UPI003B5280A0